MSEEPVEGYTTAVAGTNITNTITGTTEVKGTKTWNVPEGTKLPEKIKVYLIRNGESIDSKEVTADDNWAYSWTDLPKYSNDGMSEYTYAVDEEPVAGYNKTVEGFNITNTKSDVVTVEVTKTLTHNELALGAVDQTFYVALYGDEACTVRLSDVKAIEFKNASSATVKFTDLEIGRQYYVSECTEDGTPQETGTLADGTAYIATFPNGNSVTVTEDDGTETVYFDNEFMKLPDGFYFEGKLTVTKELLDAEGNAKNSDKTFYAGIFDDKDYKNLSSRIIGDNVLELDMNGGSESSVTARVKIQENEDCVLYVTETDADGNPVEGAKGFAYNVSYKGNTTVTLNESNLKAIVRIINKEKPKDKDKDKDKEEENKKTTTTTTNTTTNTTTSRSVKTGDNTPIALYLIILITAAGAVVLVFVYRKKRRESNK